MLHHAPAALIVCLLAGLAAPALAQQPGGNAVGVIEMHVQPVPVVVTLPGRAVAYQEAAIRPRVDGIIEDILYDLGATVSVGDPLYRIEADSYEAQVAIAEADLARATAAVPAAQATYDRYQTLVGRAVTEADLDAARVDLLQAQADVQSAQAALHAAQIDLDRTEILSPIDGVTSVSSISVGGFVTANQSDALATVTRLDPIYIDMMESSARILRMRQQIAAGAINMNDALDIALILEDGSTYAGKGTLETPEFNVSETTGTVGLRVRFDNPDRLILPGMFVRTRVILGTIDAWLVPQRAGSRNAEGDLITYFVGPDGTAEQRRLDADRSTGNAWIVTAGIADGDRLIVDGLDQLTAGMPVAPVPATIDADGVAVEASDVPAATN